MKEVFFCEMIGKARLSLSLLAVNDQVLECENMVNVASSLLESDLDGVAFNMLEATVLKDAMH
jgi:hypothetical protein